MVRQLQALGGHFAPFFTAVYESVEGNDAAAVGVTILLRIMEISAYVLTLFALARIVNFVIGGGREIVIEQEVIVEDDDEEDEDDTEPAGRSSKRAARGKKDR